MNRQQTRPIGRPGGIASDSDLRKQRGTSVIHMECGTGCVVTGLSNRCSPDVTDMSALLSALLRSFNHREDAGTDRYWQMAPSNDE